MDCFIGRSALVAAAFALLSDPGHAQDAGVPDDDADPVMPAPAAPVLVPPALQEASEAVYPPEARAQGIQGTVLLHLAIGADGKVTEATVLDPAGHGFDEAAQAAALRFRFGPALRDGQPIAARIRYRYVFQIAPAAAPVPFVPPASEAALGVAPPVPPRTPLPAPPPLEPTGPVSVQVLGSANDGQQLQRSAAAVNVIDTRKAKQQSADLGEVLARTQGVAVRRDGGLGSDARFSLNGLYDDQIRFFSDGVPLERAGYPFGIANVPVNLTDRVEVYRGVVPIRLGADALGGAVNIVSDQSYETHLGVSYQVGSFGTHRVTLAGRYHDAPTGLIAGAAAFLDRAKNDYEIDVEVPDERGRLFPATVERFHDAYISYGARVEAGVVEQPWARRLTLTGFASTYDKELQNNVVMTVPYGEAGYGETVYGATVRYEVDITPEVELEQVLNYAHRRIDFVDESLWVYDWFGQRLRERRVGGEIESDPTDQVIWDDSVFSRTRAKWKFWPGQSIEVSVSPSYTTRTGDERIQANPDARDPLTARRKLLTVVSGIEHQVDAFGDRLQNVLFVKDYVYSSSSEEVLPGNIFREREEDKHSLGVGDALRFRFTPWLYAKASYEFAARLPRPDEVFGDGVLVLANLELEPEVSHNANIGPRLELMRSPIGELTLDINAFLRESDKLIVLLGNDRFFSFQNVYKARGLGLENRLEWSSPGHYVSLDGTLTWQSVRNASDEGTFGDFDGDRIPNRPYLFASWGASLQFPGLPGADDALRPFYSGRYVHQFYRGWESQGDPCCKQTIDAQVTHAAGASWYFNSDALRTTTTVEIDNLTDAKAYDFFGVQRPGRAFYLKLTGEI